MEQMEESSNVNNQYVATDSDVQSPMNGPSRHLDEEAISSEGVEALFSQDSAENMPTKEDVRVIRKAKRTLRPGVSDVNGFPIAGPGVAADSQHTKNVIAASKNSRKSRSIFSRSRGQPKKGGAGGKGVWGKPGEEVDETGFCNDMHDPNYDSDSQDEYKLEEVDPILTDAQLDKVVEPIVLEYLEHGNTGEVEALLSQLNIGPNRYKIAKLAVMLAMDRHNPQRELVSRLISDLYSCVLSQEDIAKAFDEMLASLDDLVLDTPEANTLLGQFIARCVADDCLPPKFIMAYKGKVENEWVKSALEKADVLLSMNHGIAHLDSIWGDGGGNRSVKSLTKKIIELLKEYINSGDTNEALRCLQELDVPHFHHELVYQAGEMVIHDSGERVRDMMVQLLKFFTAAIVITADQFDKGMRRLFTDIHDICLDVPAAYVLLDQLVVKLQTEGLVNDELLKALPSRGRKRFVSEGDGGRLKPEAV